MFACETVVAAVCDVVASVRVCDVVAFAGVDAFADAAFVGVGAFVGVAFGDAYDDVVSVVEAVVVVVVVAAAVPVDAVAVVGDGLVQDFQFCPTRASELQVSMQQVLATLV
mmetsp:Transcript_17587/g.28469  ORF Transcript_17587/g.28469 Transcript_17587/m.28469 type:complete len:111 (-) Transcript_17587:1386-1718(-)